MKLWCVTEHYGDDEAKHYRDDEAVPLNLWLFGSLNSAKVHSIGLIEDFGTDNREAEARAALALLHDIQDDDSLHHIPLGGATWLCLTPVTLITDGSTADSVYQISH